MRYIHVPTGAVVTSNTALPSGQWRPIVEAPEKREDDEKPKRAPRTRKTAPARE